VRIGDFDTDREVLVIAEIGNNHEGDIALAEEMIGLAAEAGADAVKFQAIIPELLVCAQDTARIEQLRRFQLGPEQFVRLARTACQKGVLFLCTPFSINAVHFLAPLVPAYKVASSDNDFFPMLDAIVQTGKPILVSAGLTDLEQIRRTEVFIESKWQGMDTEQEMGILHCTCCYPTPDSEANLLGLRALQELGVTVGYSDHTLGIDAAVLSVALGARIVEKHFTLDKNQSAFRDHQLSADPAEFAEMVCRIRRASRMLGQEGKFVAGCEEPMVSAVRRSIVASRNLAEGKVLGWGDLNWVRLAGGLRPGEEHELVGRTLSRPISRGERITSADVMAATDASAET